MWDTLAESIVLKRLEYEEFFPCQLCSELPLHILAQICREGFHHSSACESSVCLFKERSYEREGQRGGQRRSINNPLPGPEMRSAGSRKQRSQHSPPYQTDRTNRNHLVQTASHTTQEGQCASSADAELSDPSTRRASLRNANSYQPVFLGVKTAEQMLRSM